MRGRWRGAGVACGAARAAMWRRFAGVAAVALLAVLAPAPAGAKSRVAAVDWSSQARPAAGARIVLVAPDMALSQVTAGGRLQPRADWTEAATRLYLARVHEVLDGRGAVLAPDYTLPADLPPDAPLRQTLLLHQAVGLSIVGHHFGAIKLKDRYGFDWTLGNGARALAEATGADYALFTYVRDSYTSGGRAAMMAVGALLGVGLSGGVQVGFTSLVDLRDGRVLWFSFLIDATGDLRDAEGAAETVDDLLVDFPL